MAGLRLAPHHLLTPAAPRPHGAGSRRPQPPVGDVVIPRLPELYARYPNLELQLSMTDRRLDPVREGFDCVLRVGALADSGLVARRLGVLPMTNCASPGYLRNHGTPRDVADLDRHLLVHYAGAFGAEPPVFEHRVAGRAVTRPMRAIVTVNNVDAYHAACRAGLGIIQAPRRGVAADLAAGTLAEVLPDHTCEPMPVSLVHPHGRTVPRRVRAVRVGSMSCRLEATLGGS